MTKTITNRALTLMVAIVTVFSMSLISFSTASAMTNDELGALLLTLGMTQEQVDAVLASMDEDSTSDDTSSSSCGTTETYVHHPNINYEFTKFMKRGSRGTEVEMLQKVLNAANGTSISEDGIFGNGTKNAVMTFQAANGLGADGLVGAMTRAELNKKTTTTVACDDDNDDDNSSSATEDKLTVSGIASDDMIVGVDQTIVFAKLKLAAGTKDVDVKKIYVKYTGTADADVIDKVVLLDSAMLEIDTDSLDSDDEATLKADLTVKDGESTTVYLAAVTAHTFSSDNLDGSLKVTSISTDEADVEGDSIQGASHTFNDGVSVDDFNVDIDNESGDVKIGEEDVKVTTITIKAGDDAQTVKSMKLERTASASKAGDDDLANVYIKVKGVKYKALQDDEDYTFDFEDGIFLEEDGDDEDFVLYADIEDGSGSLFRFDITDVVVTDENGILLSKDGASTLADAGDEFTIELSEVTISKTTDTQSDKVAAGQDAVELASFEVEVTGKDLEGDVKITIVASNVEVEDADGVVSTDANKIDLKDIDLDNVAIYTADGDRVSDKEDTSFSITPADGTADQVTYEITFDDVTFEAGEDAVDYVIKGDINEDAVDGAKYEINKIVYTSIEDTDGEDISDVTETIASPATIEIEGAVIEVSVEEADDTDVNADADDVEVAQIKFDASNSGDDIRVTKIKLAFAVDTTAAAAAGGDDATAPEADIDDLRNCELFDGSTSLSDKEDAGASVTFDVDFIVTKDTEKNLSVKCDIGSDFENADTITVTGIDFDAKGVNTDTDLDAAITDNAVATVTTGDITFTVSSDDENDDKVVRDNADKVVLGVYEFKAKDAELTLDDVTFNFTGDVSDRIDGKIEIFVDDSSEGSENLNGAGTAVVFENISKTIAKDQTVVIRFEADMDTAGTITPASVVATTEEGPTATVTEAHPVVTVVPAIPVITKVDVDTDNLETADDVVLFTYKVKAEGGDIVLGNTVFETQLTNVTLANTKVKVYDNSGMTGSEELEIIAAALDGVAGSEFNADLSPITVSENDTYYIFIISDVTAGDDTRVIRAKVADVTYNAATPTGMTFTDIDDETAGDQNLDASLILEDDMKALLKKD